ncbi:MAG: J domain-containing protein [Alphaproteobacteria bacterium]|nr:MAG: J domain-containing protein [Alphaproteobacteria bacterium]
MTERQRDFYEVLGVEKTANGEEIRRAYRRLALKYHPDRNSGDTEAEKRFKEAAAAYEVLSDEKKKKNYDLFGHEGLRSGVSASTEAQQTAAQAATQQTWKQKVGVPLGFKIFSEYRMAFVNPPRDTAEAQLRSGQYQQIQDTAASWCKHFDSRIAAAGKFNYDLQQQEERLIKSGDVVALSRFLALKTKIFADKVYQGFQANCITLAAIADGDAKADFVSKYGDITREQMTFTTAAQYQDYNPTQIIAQWRKELEGTNTQTNTTARPTSTNAGNSTERSSPIPPRPGKSVDDIIAEAAAAVRADHATRDTSKSGRLEPGTPAMAAAAEKLSVETGTPIMDGSSPVEKAFAAFNAVADAQQTEGLSAVLDGHRKATGRCAEDRTLHTKCRGLHEMLYGQGNSISKGVMEIAFSGPAGKTPDQKLKEGRFSIIKSPQVDNKTCFITDSDWKKIKDSELSRMFTPEQTALLDYVYGPMSANPPSAQTIEEAKKQSLVSENRLGKVGAHLKAVEQSLSSVKTDINDTRAATDIGRKQAKVLDVLGPAAQTLKLDQGKFDQAMGDYGSAIQSSAPRAAAIKQSYAGLTFPSQAGVMDQILDSRAGAAPNARAVQYHSHSVAMV